MGADSSLRCSIMNSLLLGNARQLIIWDKRKLLVVGKQLIGKQLKHQDEHVNVSITRSFRLLMNCGPWVLQLWGWGMARHEVASFRMFHLYAQLRYPTQIRSQECMLNRNLPSDVLGPMFQGGK